MSLARLNARSVFKITPSARLISSSPHTRSDITTKDSQEQSSRADIAKPIVIEDAIAADVTSGAPSELRHRAVRIYQPTRNTMQSGGAHSSRWRIDWEILQGAGRWENSLMGWASSADYMQGTRMSFSSKEAAIRFAEEQGWDYYLQTPMVKKIPPKNYAENYAYNPKELRIMKTK